MIRILLLFAWFLPGVFCYANQVVSPIDYGVLTANTGIERYECLFRCHMAAIKNNAHIDYSGIKQLDLEVPVNANPIPLPCDVDFAKVTINVLNKQRGQFLFTRINATHQINVTANDIDKGTFLHLPELNRGRKLLIVTDGNPWVGNRSGYDYGATRKDILVVKGGQSLNKVACEYGGRYSSPKAIFAEVEGSCNYRNLTFNRDSQSTRITYLIQLINLYDVTLSNITLITPQDNDFYGDAAIQIKQSAKVLLKNVNINGTYSQKNQYGYGINLDNVSMLTCERLYARARWGVFGTNNVNNTILRDCDINRFDIHCYGRDVRCYNCKFTDLYNQFSSIYGDVYFEECTFNNFVPVLMESSYNAYTPFDITFKKCTFNMTQNRNFLITLLGLEEAHNSRPELSRKALPNVSIKDCFVNLPDGLKEWYIVNTGKVQYKEPLDYMSHITIDGLTVNQPCNFDLFSSEIKTTTPLNVSIMNMYVKQNGKRKKYVMPYATVDDKAKVKCNGKTVRRKIG